MQQKTFLGKHLCAVRYNSASPGTKDQFEQWVLTMTPDLDGEQGGGEQGALAWVQAHNANFDCDGLYGTFIFTDQESGQVVATGSLVPDDRDVAKTYSISGLGFWGFVNVRRDLRGQGLGKFVSAYMDQHVQRYVDLNGQPAAFSLFTANPVAVRIYESLGFKFVKQIYVAAFEATEDLYTKIYNPAAEVAVETIKE